MFNVSESESIVFKELDLFYHFIMGFNLFNYIFDKYEFLYNKFYGFVKKKLRQSWVLYGQFSSYYYLHINISMLLITVSVSNI